MCVCVCVCVYVCMYVLVCVFTHPILKNIYIAVTTSLIHSFALRHFPMQVLHMNGWANQRVISIGVLGKASMEVAGTMHGVETFIHTYLDVIYLS